MIKLRRKKKKQQTPQSNLGRIIDLPFEEFKKEIVEQKVPIGVLTNIKLNFFGAFSELGVRKDNIIKQITSGELSKDDPKVTNVLNGLYAEMTKIEQKSLFLTERIKDLADVDKGVVDSPNN